MSKEFLTVMDASNKLGLPGSTNTYTFITKGAAITAGTNSSLTVELVGTAPVSNRNEFFWLAIGY